MLLAALVGVFAVVVPATATAAPHVLAGSPDDFPVVRSGVAAPAPAGQRTPGVRPEVLPPGAAFTNLQFNLCNSGVAGCYEGGRSVPEAQRVITANSPDVVTVNESCLPDVRDHLFQTMVQKWQGDAVFWAFMPAWNASQNAPYQCANGRGEFGNGIIGRVRAGAWSGMHAFGGIYAQQDGQSNERRSWVCAQAVNNYYGCTTHLTNRSGSVALQQCNYLLRTIIPALWARQGERRPTVVGGDFNLRYRGSPNVQNCVPSGWFRKGDGSVQHWFVTNDFTFDFSRKISMQYTDHPGWLVALRVR